jgi:hypothetical protein
MHQDLNEIDHLNVILEASLFPERLPDSLSELPKEIFEGFHYNDLQTHPRERRIDTKPTACLKYAEKPETPAETEKPPADTITKEELMEAFGASYATISRDFGTLASKDYVTRERVIDRIEFLLKDGRIHYKNKITNNALNKLGFSGIMISRTPPYIKKKRKPVAGISYTQQIKKQEPHATEPEMPAEGRKPPIRTLVESKISAEMERRTIGAIEEPEPGLATEAVSILEILDGGDPEETEIPEHVPILETDEILRLLGMREVNIAEVKKLLSERGKGLMATPHELAFAITEMGDEIFSRYGKYFKKSPGEVMEELAIYLPHDDEGRPLYSAEGIEGTGWDYHDNSRHTKGPDLKKKQPLSSKGRHRTQATREVPMKETAYHSMLTELRQNGETVRASEVMEEIRSTSGLSVSYTDISALFYKYHEGFRFLGAKSELPRGFLDSAAEVFRGLEDMEHGDNKLESWRASMGIIEYGDILYIKYGETWMCEGLTSASNTIQEQLDKVHKRYLVTGSLPRHFKASRI